MNLEDLTTSDRPSIHPTAFVAPSATVVGDVTLEAHASVWYGCLVRGDIAPITVGPETNIQDLTVVHVDRDRGTAIGPRVGIGHRAIIHGCDIEEECLIGMGAIILSHAVIGAGSVVAAGALVREGKRVPPGSLVVGVPGRIVREVDEELRERILRTVSDYKSVKEGHRSGRWKPVDRT